MCVDVFIILNIDTKFRFNWMLFTIRAVNSCFVYNFKIQKKKKKKNFKFKHFIDEMVIDF